MARARCSSAPTRSRSRLSPTRSSISRTAIGRCLTREGVAIRDRAGNAVQRPVDPLARHRAPGRQGQPPPFHGEGDPRAAGSRRPYAREPCRSRPSSRVELPELPFDFAKLHAALDLGLRHGLLCRPRRQILVRALGARFPSTSISPRSSATGRAGCEPGGAALFISQSGETADTLATLRHCREHGQRVALHRQCARIVHRARSPTP